MGVKSVIVNQPAPTICAAQASNNMACGPDIIQLKDTMVGALGNSIRCRARPLSIGVRRMLFVGVKP
ncbi:hypothetical protein D3C76_1538760 [compost metagenome]